MAEQRSFARAVMALSSLVVAACAVTVTIKVMNTNTEVITVNQPRVMDQKALELQVQHGVGGLADGTPPPVACPASVLIQKDNQFSCFYWEDGLPRQVNVTITDENGEVKVDG